MISRHKIRFCGSFCTPCVLQQIVSRFFPSGQETLPRTAAGKGHDSQALMGLLKKKGRQPQMPRKNNAEAGYWRPLRLLRFFLSLGIIVL